MKAFVLIATLFVAASALAQPVFEPLGPSSRRTPFAVSEIMYKPAARADGRNLEYIELYNSNPWPEDISGYQLNGQVQFTFPAATAIPGQSFIVVAAVPADMQAVYGLTNVFGPYTNSLKTSGAVTLSDEQGSLVLDVSYDNIAPWPMGADGTGHSIVLARPSYGEGDPQAWERSELAGGSPGAAEAIQTNAWRSVVLNEVLAHTDPPEMDTIELYNHGNADVDLSGCTLSDAPATNKFVIPPGMVIPARGFVYFTETQLGFGLSSAGETIYFKNPAATQVLDALKFGAQENGVSFGRFPDGATEWSRLTAPTFGTNNAAPLVSAVGFNEIMYHPLSGVDDAQYVELFNHGTHAINLGGWKIGGGISFTFPTNQILAANGYLVVARSTTCLFSNYAQLNAANTVGNFSGKLSGSGEPLTLTMPDTTTSTNGSGRVTTNYLDIVMDEVTYGTGGRWGRWSDGGGSSLEVMDARADKRRASNWADSDDTAKSAWATIATTGVLDNGGLYDSGISFAQLGLLDAGECLVDDVEVRPGTTGANYVANPSFDSGLTNWTLLGDHSRSSLETNSGYPSGGSALHLRTADSVAVGPNGTQVTLTNTGLASGQTATLRFKARWLRGWPEVLLRLRGNYLEATGRLPVPANLGTPGLPNSQAATNAGPSIYQVSHSPAVPAANQPVVVTARATDPDGVASFSLSYRFDPQLTTTNVVMNDAGTNGDLVAGDGIYSATIPGRAAKSAVAFTLQATDTQGATSRFPDLVPDNAPGRECVVIFGDATPTNLFGTYHLWLSQTNVSRWTNLPILSNEDIDGTLVYNSRVIYNMGGRYSGSPWHQYYDSPAGSRACHFVWSMPKDDRLLGTSSFNKIHWPGNDIQYDSATANVNDPTLQREQAANTFLRSLGAPWIYRRFVAVYVNGVRRGNLMEDAYRPNASGVRDGYFPNDTAGQYYKLEPWYEFPASGSTNYGQYTNFTRISWCLLASYTTTGGAWKPARYRSNWGLLETPDSLSNFTNVYALVTAAYAGFRPNYVNLMENVADMDNWIQVSAANHAAGNWDMFGSQSGQNAYGWVSPQHRWTLFTIDFSICLGNSIALGPGSSLFSDLDPSWSKIMITPKFLRMYWRALADLANGAMLPTKINPLMDAKYAAFRAAGLISVASPASTETWVATARSSILSQIAAADAAGFTLAANAYDATSNTVTLTGFAPFQATTIEVNGETFTPVWTTPTNWSLAIPAAFGTNVWTIGAYDRSNNPVGGILTASVGNSTQPELPAGNVVLNEIMYNPPVAGAEYVELFNRATNTTFDLSGWAVNGLGYTFPSGSLLAPQGFLVLAKSRPVFAATYGGLTSVFDEFTGTLQTDGETLTLIQPDTNTAANVVIDRVRYEPKGPWPTNPAIIPGVSLQLVDAAQDNSRVANWSSSLVTRCTPGANNSVAGTLPEFPALWLNEAQAENLTGPLDNAGEHDPWVELYNPGTNTISLDGFYLGTNYTSATNWAFPAGASIAPGQFLVVWLDGQPGQSNGTSWHTSFRLTATGGALALARLVNGSVQIVDYLNYLPLTANYSYGDFPDGQPFYRQTMFYLSPGKTNNSTALPITVFVNEWMAENTAGLIDPGTGKYDDWFELFNPSRTPADLAGYYLTDTLSNPFQYQIPAGYRVPAKGFLLVWADNKTSANSTNSPYLHVPFKLDKGGEAIGLFAPDGTAMDAIVFSTQTANISEGRYPDGGTLRLYMPTPSPLLPNVLPAATNSPTIAAFALLSNRTIALTFQTSPGHTYRVEYKNDLTDSNWLPLGADYFAIGATQTINDSPGSSQRFYRVHLIQ